MAVSLSTMRTNVLTVLGDTTNTIWATAEIDRYLQWGYDELCLLTNALWKQAYSNDTASTATYSLPTDFLAIDRVTWDYRRIHPATARELREFDSRYRTTEGNVWAYSIENDGVLTLRKYPVPSTTPTAGARDNNTYIEYYARGAALSAAGDTIELPDRYAKYIQWFATWRALERKGEGQDLKFAEHWKLRWLDGVARLIRRKEMVQRQRIMRLGGSARPFPRTPRARLPWNFGKVVR